MTRLSIWVGLVRYLLARSGHFALFLRLEADIKLRSSDRDRCFAAVR
jgi:hypothetical protein